MEETSQCSAITAAGRRCSARAQPGQEWCYNHSPSRAEERRLNAHAGGEPAPGAGPPRWSASRSA
jgi:hypothetical protein